MMEIYDILSVDMTEKIVDAVVVVDIDTQGCIEFL